MIFAVNIGETETSGTYIPGKVYIAKPRMENSDAVDLSFVRIEDETGRDIPIKPSKTCGFWFPKELPVVITSSHLEGRNMQCGDVVMGSEIRDGEFLRCRGGFISMKCLTVLDGTLLVPGSMVFEPEGAVWREVVSVGIEEWNWMSIGLKDGGNFRRPVTKFILPTMDGELSDVQFVTSLVDTSELKKGNIYQMCRLLGTDKVTVIIDGGEFIYKRNFFNFSTL